MGQRRITKIKYFELNENGTKIYQNLWEENKIT